jgi:hypothetical protein
MHVCTSLPAACHFRRNNAVLISLSTPPNFRTGRARWIVLEICHLHVSFHVCPMIYGCSREGERKGEVLGQTALLEPGTIPQGELFHHTSRLDHDPACDFRNNFQGDRQGESMEHILC